jgi:hypothetical protein
VKNRFQNLPFQMQLAPLHRGFCLPDAAQQEYSYTAMRANAGGGLVPRQQTLSQVGLRRGLILILHFVCFSVLTLVFQSSS